MNRMGDIDWNLKPLQPVLYLARSDRKTITRLSEAKNIVFNEASEKVFELDFSLPYYIEKNGQMIKNPNIDKIGVMMLVKMELGEREEWFILSTPSTSTDSDGDEHNYKAFSTANQMSGVTIRGYSSEQPRILSDYLDILISSSGETYWTKGYVDGALDAKFRSFEFDSGNLLQAIYELATKFEAIVEFDSVQSKVNMYAKENYGRDEKLVVSHDNYLVQATKTEDALAMVTQMALYGSDGLTINRISPTGANYIEDFSYFLQGFEYDFENNKVLSSSKFMSDELALALVKYSQLVYSKGETFKRYLDEIEEIELELIPKIIEMNDLKTALNVVKNDIDIWLTQNNGVANAELNQKRDELESAIYELSVYIDTRKARITEIAGETYLTDRFIQYGAEGGLMGLLKEEMLLTNNFSNELLDERANFIIKKDYTNDSIIDDRDLLEEGIKEFERLKEPKIDVSMDMLNILDLIEAQRDWNRLKLGDKIRIVSPEIDLDVYAHINEVTYEFEDGKIKVNITNISRAMSRKDAFLDLMYKANTASNSIQVNKDSWSKGKDADDKVNAILNNVWDATKNKISGGVYSTVEISDRGILSRDPDDPDNTYLVLLNGLLAITQDGGKSWKNAITNMGVIAERLYGQIITGQNLTIGDADGILQFVGNKGIVSDSDGNMVMKLGLVEEATQVGQADKYGILLFRGSTNKVYLTQEDGMVIQKANGDGWENVFSADIDGNFTAKDFSMVNMRIVNAEIAGQGVYLDSQDGIRVDGAGMRQIMINADKGIEMLDIIGNRVFYVDGNGNINVTGINIISGNLAGRDIETVGQSIDDLEVALIDVETYIDGAFKDGVINEAEAKIIANHLETLNNEKADIDAHYTTVYADANLTGTPKTALFASKTEYDSKHTSLITAINNAIADDKVTTAEKTNVDTKFDDYRVALADISKKLEEAKKAITDAVVEPVKTEIQKVSATLYDSKLKGGNVSVFGATDFGIIASEAESLGLNTLTFPIRIEAVSATDSNPTLNITDWDKIKNFIVQAKNQNYKVILEPYPYIANGTIVETDWNPSNKANWFTAWGNHLRTIATFAEANKVEAMYIASNLTNMESMTSSWESLISSLRPIFSGDLIYRTNWWITASWANETVVAYQNKLNNPIFGLVDVIAIASYFELTDALRPTKEELKSAIFNVPLFGRGQNIHDEIKAFHDTWNKPVMFGELGIPAWEGASKDSWNYNQNGRAYWEEMQANWFNAWKEVFYPYSWFKGYSIYAIGQSDSAYRIKEKGRIAVLAHSDGSLIGSISSIDSRVTESQNQLTIIEATATDAFANSENAELIAGNAQQTANTAIANAQTALTNAGTALTDAQSALNGLSSKENTILKQATAPTNPATGQLWLDTSNANLHQLKRWSGTAWITATPTTPSQVGAEAIITKSNTAPTHGLNKIWMNTSVEPNVLYRSTGSAWIKVTPTTAGEVGAYTIAQTDSALNNKVSTTTYNLDKNAILKSIEDNSTAITQTDAEIALKASTEYVNSVEQRVTEAEAKITIQAGLINSKVSSSDFDGVAQRLTQAESNITQTANSVNTKVETATFNTEIAKKENTITKGTTAPSSPVVGQLWLDTSTTVNQLKRWTGSVWAKATPTTATEVGAEANITKSNTAPASPASGQLWLDTNFTPNRLKRWSGSAWVDATPTTASQVGAESTITKSATAPTHLDGRLWLDTTVTPNILYRSTGSAWVKATPTTASEVGAYSASAGTTLNANVTTAIQDIDTLKGQIVNKVETTDFSIFKKTVGNLVSNPTMTGVTVGWNNSTSSGTTIQVESVTDFDGANSINALTTTTTGNLQTYSDQFEVDPSKTYEFSMWIKNSVTTGNNYMGINPYLADGSTKVTVTPVSISTGIAGTATDNPYFWNGGKTTTWRRVVGFLFPTGTNPASIKNLIPAETPELSTTAYIMPSNMRKAEFRFLNWDSATVNVKTFVINPRVIETNSDLIIPRFSNLQSSIEQTNNSITSRVAKTTIDTVNKTGVFNDVLNSRVNTATHTGYLVIDTGITLTDQMTNITIQGYNYSDAGNSLIDLDVSFYARSNSTFSNMGYVNKGSLDPEQVRVAIKNSKVSIILGSPTRVWSYPNILVPKVQVSHGTPVASFGNGWALSTATAISGFTAVTVVPVGKFRSGVNQVTNSTFNSYEAPTETVLTRNPREWEGNGLNIFDILDPDEKSPYSHILRMYRTGLASDANLAIYSKAIPLDSPASKIYTFSFDVKITGLSTILDGSAVVRLMTFADAESTTTASQTITITKKNIVDKGLTDGNWFRFKYQVPPITAGAFLRVSPFLQRNGDVQIRNIMFEEGTDFSDWNPSPSDTTSLIYRIAEAEQKITEKSIVSTVRNSDYYKNDFGAYVSSDSLAEMGFVDENGLKSSLDDINDILKTLTEDMSTVKSNYTTVSQTAKDITLGVSSGGGINRLINSVGWAGVGAGWTQVLGSGGSVNVRQDENVPVGELGELELLGAGSAWILKNSSITQKIRTPLTRDIVLADGTTQNVSASYTVSALIKKTATDSALVFQISTDGTTFTTVGTTLNEAYTWRLFSATFTPTTDITHIRIASTGATGQTEVTNLLVNDGDIPMQWSNHPTELYSTNARFDRFGMVISNNTTQNYTKITTDEFAGYAPVNGVITQIFTLNGSTTEVNNLDATEFISVGTIKIQRINAGGRKGVAFLPIEDDDV